MIRLAALLALLASPTLSQGIVLDPPPTAVIAADAGALYDTTSLVVLTDDAAGAGRLTAAAPFDLLSRETLGGLGQEMLVFRLPPGVTGGEAIRQIETLEPGATAGVNHAYRAPVAASLPKGREYANALIGWPAAGCAARVPVGILDTDIDPRAPGLAGVAIERRSFAPGGDTAHGTAIAQLIAGPGRLTGVRLYHAAVIGRTEGGEPAAGVDTLVRALNWMQESGVGIVNVSLAGPYNKILDRAVQAADRRGLIVVAAAGNTGRDGPPRYPAAFRQTIGVTALDAALALYTDAPEGGHIDIAAPGVDVFVPRDGGVYLSGTSVAAPFVTAVLAADPEAARLGSAAAAREWLAGRARDLGPAGPDRLYGSGLVQARGACGGG
ncbi:MAG: S8 family serine peptidase [Pseudooceanicola sp.]|nr:S8 family serine peptidase [Pseudooceanicola sp.]